MRKTIPFLLLALFACSKSGSDTGPDPEPTPGEVVTYGNESLVAIDPAGKEIAFDYRHKTLRDKKVGIFYFIWLGAHGYDAGDYFGGDIIPPKATDTRSPYDISELEKGHSNPADIPFGPGGAMHHWGKPYLDYYVSNDTWIIRRHAQMLSEAGVDVIFIDVTNGYAYLPVVKTLCNVYVQMMREGNPRPQISFILNTNPAPVVKELLTLYSNSDYDRLWYELDGKPLLLAPPGDYGTGVASRLTFRYAWFDTQYNYGGNWYGDGTNRWAWGEFSPQRNVKEEMPVMVASHPVWNIGRSYTGNSPNGYGGHQPANPTAEQRAAGTYFKQQFERALECDPDLIFLTGWNEWVAQRQGNTGATFIDCYNHEFSRDIEPCADDFTDVYYYYMADYVRRYKGVTPVEPVKEIHQIAVDGKFDDWTDLGTRYKDYKGDTRPRNHWGFGYKNISLTNNTGRNDICYAKVATDCKSLFFHVETAEPITPRTDRNWMRLFISVKGSTAPAWEGFQWVVNNRVVGENRTTLQRSKGGWDWEEAATVDYAVSGNQMEIAIPLSELGITDVRDFTVDFKWIDNAVADGDIRECMRDGDSAPGDRFRYRYIFKY